MEVKKHKAISLQMLFLKYLAIFCFTMIFLVTVIIVSFYYALEKGIILPANYAEQSIQNMENQLMKVESFDESLIPFPCTYVLLSETGDVQKSNMSKDEISRAKEYLLGKIGSLNKHYKSIKCNDGNILVIKYDLWAHFTSPALHKLFPRPEIVAIMIFLCAFILMAVVLALNFSKKLKKELAPLIIATDSIKQKDLDFDFVPTKIKEINTVLQSISELKTALSDSLIQQWDIEQSKKNQISAIAHDIKTPLTIIKGNAELLLEAKLTREDKNLLQYIQSNSNRIENYIELLMTATTVTDSVDFHKCQFSIRDFLLEIEEQAKALCYVKNITLCIERNILEETFYGDVLLINRAILNLLDNAVEYSSDGSKIEFKINGNKELLSFTIADNGKGFSVAALKNATMQFFTEQTERSGRHYGMGLYIAKMVAEKHGGQIEVANRPEGCGAIVSLIIRNQ